MFQLKIDTGNAAFCSDEDEFYDDDYMKRAEVRRILHRVAIDIAQLKTCGKCIDINGNIVGEWSLT